MAKGVKGEKDLEVDEKGEAAFLAFSACIPCSSHRAAFKLFLLVSYQNFLFSLPKHPHQSALSLLLLVQAGIYFCLHFFIPFEPADSEDCAHV